MAAAVASFYCVTALQTSVKEYPKMLILTVIPQLRKPRNI